MSNVHEDIKTLSITLRSDAEPKVRQAVAVTASRGLLRELIPDLTWAMIEDVSEDVQVAAAESLGKLKAQEAIPQLLLALQTATPRVSQAILGAMRRIGGSDIPGGLSRLLRESPHDYVRGKAALALAELGFVAAIPELAQAALGDDDSSVRCAAARALAVLDVPESVPHLMKAFESEKDFHVRLGHAYLFSNMRCDGVNAALLKLLEDPDPMYRIAAAHGLGWRHARDCSGELIRALRGDVDADVRADAAVALGLARASEASADLIEALNSDESDWVRASAAYALGDLRSREAFPHLVRALRTSKDVDVRMNAAVALGFLFGRQVHVYEEMLRDFQRRPPEAPTG